MTIRPADHESPHDSIPLGRQEQLYCVEIQQQQQQQPPPLRNRSPRTPPPPPPSSSSSRSPIRTANASSAVTTMPMQTRPPFSSVSAPVTPVDGGRMLAANLPAAAANLQHQQRQLHTDRKDAVIAAHADRQEHSYNRRHPPPPPPPHLRRPSSSDDRGLLDLDAAAQELRRAHSAGSGVPDEGRRRSNSNSSSRVGGEGGGSSWHRGDSRGSSSSVGSSSARDRRRNGGGDSASRRAQRQHSGSSSRSQNGTATPPGFVRRDSGDGGRNGALDGSSSSRGGSQYGPNSGNGSHPRAGEGGGGGDFERDGEWSADDAVPKDCVSRLLGALLCIFPKVEPLPWGTFAVLTMWSAIPPACFILFFTQMGFGETIYYTIAFEMGHHANVLALGLAVFLFLLYMLDADEWSSSCGNILLDICVLAAVCGVVLLVLLIADRFPYGMVCLFAVFNPLWLLALKLVFYDSKDTRAFVSWLSGPLFFVSVVAGAVWTAWVFSDPDNEWNVVARMSAADRTGCVPNYDNHPDCRLEPGSEATCFYVEREGSNETIVYPEGCEQSCTNVYNDCPNGFILWVGPVLVSMTTFFLSFFCTFLRTEGAREKDVLNFGVIWIFILFAVWVTTSLAGTAAGVTAALAALTLASFVASAMFLAVSFSKEERSQNASAVMDRMTEKYGKYLDVARGLFVVTCAPIVLAYLGLSMTNQVVRRCGVFPCSQPPGEEGDVYTTRTRKQVDVMRSWNRARVYTYAVYWGIAFMILQVLVANLTTVFLSWMIQKTANLGLAAVTVIMCCVGVMMFLLPPVPGVPVYLTLGIVLPAQGHTAFGWPGAIMYSVAIGLLLKLFSSMLQQKLIGEKLSYYVKVRQFVGINSTFMKAGRLVLGKDGLSVPKVAILIGGPDWPTSVLCGIMRLSLPQIMLGTIPIVFLILPTCLSGALLYMASLETDNGNPEFPWAGTVSTITLSLTAVVQFGSMIVAAYYLEQTASKNVPAIEAIPTDREVKEADDKAANLRRCYHDVTKWDVVPISAKLLLQTSLAAIISSSYMVQLFSNLCFTPHSLTDSIGENLDGKVSNLFLPLGWVALGLFGLSIILIYLFESWGEQKAYKLANGIAILASPDESSIGNSSSDGTPDPDNGLSESGRQRTDPDGRYA